MEKSFYNEQWYRVAELKPQLAPHVRVVQRRERGVRWTILVDDTSGRTHRVNELAWQLLGRCDGVHTVDRIWQETVAALGAEAPTQSDAIRLLAGLSEKALLQGNALKNIEVLQRRRDTLRAERARAALNPFAIRIPLLDPDAFLVRTQWLVRPLFSRAAFVLWCGLLLAALLAVVLSHDSPSRYAAVQLASADGWLLTGLCYVVMKLLHELGHAYALRSRGGEVHAVGVTLLLFIPVPWVDGSAASALPQRRDRLLVSAIGIMVELAIAAAAACLWVGAQDGLLREIAFTCMCIGTISTLLFNGNPLLRFDGYYLLSDLLGIQNLAGRAQALLWHTFCRHALRVRSMPTPPTEAGERPWLLGYGSAALIYRWVLSISLVFWAAHWSWIAAAAMAGAALFMLVLMPSRRALKWLFSAPLAGAERWRSWLLASCYGAALLVLIGVVPMPHHVVADAVVWAPEDSQIRADVAGVVEEIMVKNGSVVQLGDPLFRIRNPELAVKHATARARLVELDVEYFRALKADSSAAAALIERIEAVKTEIDQIDRQMQDLEPSARSAGRALIAQTSDLIGTWVEQGMLLGHVVGASPPMLRVVLSEADADAVRRGVQRVDVWMLHEGRGHSVPARLVRQLPAAVRELPSAAFGTVGGGPLPVDPTDPKGRRLLKPVFVADVELDALIPADVVTAHATLGAVETRGLETPAALTSTLLTAQSSAQSGQYLLGARARVRFVLPDAPLAEQWGHALMQTFLHHLTPSAL